MSSLDGVARRAIVGAIVVITIVSSVSVAFFLTPSFGLQAAEIEQIQIIGMGTILLLSSVGTVFLAMKIIAAQDV